MAAIPPNTYLEGFKRSMCDGIEGAFNKGVKQGRYLEREEGKSTYNQLMEALKTRGFENIEAVFAELDQVKHERDVAVQCIPRVCAYCKHVIDYGLFNSPGCKIGYCYNTTGFNIGWEWRGLQEEK